MRSLTAFLRSPSRRARAALYLGLACNVLFAAFKLFTGVFYRSFWFAAAAIYYTLLCTIKFFLIRADKKFIESEKDKAVMIRAFNNYKRCGKLLLLLNLSMAVIVVIIVKYNRTAHYSSLVLTVFGIYTLCRAAFSIHDIKRLRRIDDPLLSASKHLGLSVTLMSIFSLQTALLDRFCGNVTLRQNLNGMTGAAVCASVIGIAVSMIVSGSRRLRKLKI